MSVSVLVVCTGNVCRSPVTERLLRQGLDARRVSGVTVGSAGTDARAGEPMTAEAASIVVRAGGDPTGHAARPLSDRLLAEADLVLVATRAHRTSVVQRRPALLRRAVTIREAGRLALLLAPGLVGRSPAERWCELASSLAVARGRWPAPHPADDDVEDPYRRDAATYARVGLQVQAAVTSVLAALDHRG
ncbi:low molecular weight phosphatase family protein [Kineococcus sp. R8]|uniref:arsenate reductase/protein-tyrosine-phosphatase family protein n=1 Tax=Kineococcus siccus TaxID=2696567 RepID=UPI001412C754|nr:low molecular weight phosphatase family protein [Kineococcus siccus]